MNTTTFALILSGVLLNTVAQLLLKAGTNSFSLLDLGLHRPFSSAVRIATEPHIVAGVTCYVISLGVWIIVLSRAPVSVAFPMLSMGYVVNALAAWWLFAEPLSTYKIIGIGVIMIGVILVSRA